MRVNSTIAVRCFRDFAAGPAGPRRARRGGNKGRGRNEAAGRDPVFPRSSARCQRRTLRAGDDERFVRRGGSRGQHQYRQRIAGRHRAGRRRHQRLCAGRHQRADPLSRQSRRAARQGGVHAVQQGALRHHCAQESRHPGALRHDRQNARRCGGRLLGPALAGAGAAERNQGRQREAEPSSAPPCGTRCCRRARSTQ